MIAGFNRGLFLNDFLLFFGAAPPYGRVAPL
ncbi:hypothetical protein SGRA_3757 [Saprospira grandis str. Lewin]|uniref:Uncharacterized protein n=1 Tax=Saprospira grandis (strain Lewin) TaxID=984262 RepID=H6L8A9_SAPGL|nr:hypothetical protein SGRA_3757 [Saprospira grandis str. Lewin]